MSNTYTAIQLINDEIRAKSPRLGQADFHAAIGQIVTETTGQIKKLERRLYRIGRE